MSEAPDKKDEVKPVDPAIVAEVKDELKEVAKEVATTPEGERDTQWRTELSSRLTEISETLADLKSTQGTSPELRVLTEEMAKLSTAVLALKSGAEDPSPKPAPDGEADPPSPATETEILSETDKPPKKAPATPKTKPEKKAHI